MVLKMSKAWENNNLLLLFLTYKSCAISTATTATAKSLQSCPTLCDPVDGSPLGSSVPGILQARILEWVAMDFCLNLPSFWRCWSQEHSLINLLPGLPWWLRGKESACQCRRHGLHSWSGKIPYASKQLNPCATTVEPVRRAWEPRVLSPRAATAEACGS